MALILCRRSSSRPRPAAYDSLVVPQAAGNGLCTWAFLRSHRWSSKQHIHKIHQCSVHSSSITFSLLLNPTLCSWDALGCEKFNLAYQGEYEDTLLISYLGTRPSFDSPTEKRLLCNTYRLFGRRNPIAQGSSQRAAACWTSSSTSPTLRWSGPGGEGSSESWPSLFLQRLSQKTNLLHLPVFARVHRRSVTNAIEC